MYVRKFLYDPYVYVGTFLEVKKKYMEQILKKSLLIAYCVESSNFPCIYESKFIALLSVCYLVMLCSGQGSIPGCVIPKIQKMVFDAALLNTKDQG